MYTLVPFLCALWCCLVHAKWCTAQPRGCSQWVFLLYIYTPFSSGSSGWVRGARNMKYMRSPLAAIFFRLIFTGPGGHGPLDPPDQLLPFVYWKIGTYQNVTPGSKQQTVQCWQHSKIEREPALTSCYGLLATLLSCIFQKFDTAWIRYHWLFGFKVAWVGWCIELLVVGLSFMVATSSVGPLFALIVKDYNGFWLILLNTME